MTPEDRRATQEAFAAERVDIVVATVAFGMGIDRSNVRYVIHAAMPKSVEHYQQETGRAGRDGLPSECVLLFSGSDIITLSQRSSRSRPGKPAHRPSTSAASLRPPRRDGALLPRRRPAATGRSSSTSARTTQSANCAACDLCLGDTRDVPGRDDRRPEDSLVRGAREGELRRQPRDRGPPRRGHRGHPLARPRDALDVRTPERGAEGRPARLGLSTHRPGRARTERGRVSAAEAQRGVVGSDEGRTDRAPGPTRGRGGEVTDRPERCRKGPMRSLFEELRTLRRAEAARAGIQPYLVFHDNVLAELARGRPTTEDGAAARVRRRRLQAAIVRSRLPGGDPRLLQAHRPTDRRAHASVGRARCGAANRHVLRLEVAGVSSSFAAAHRSRRCSRRPG